MDEVSLGEVSAMLLEEVADDVDDLTALIGGEVGDKTVTLLRGNDGANQLPSFRH